MQDEEKAYNLAHELKKQDEQEMLLEQEEILKEEFGPKECEICQEQVKFDLMHPLHDCGHSFCRDCIQKYFITEITSKKLPIKVCLFISYLTTIVSYHRM